MQLDPVHCYEAIRARDARFDGLFFVGVSTTGVYCRPVCTARTPGRDRCSYFTTAAGAEAAGHRPCLKCRPELAPGQAPVDAVKRLAQRAVAAIEAGALDEDGIEALAASLSLSSRQLRRVVEQAYGVTPVALAQTRRLLLAKHLLTDSRLRMADVAFASGFSSVRRFNHLFRTRYRLTPQALRRANGGAESDGIMLKLAYRPPLPFAMLAGFLASRGAGGVESWDGTTYRRALRIGTHRGWIAAAPVAGANLLRVEASPSLLPVLTALIARLRRLFDLDANPGIIESHLAQDARLAAHILRAPGLRIPGAVDGFEIALRAVLGQQVSVKAASTIYGRFAKRFGEEVQTPFADVNRLPPTADRLAQARLPQLLALGITRARAETVRALSRAIAEGRVVLEPLASPSETMAALQALPGIGPWTAHYVAMRALGDPDAFPEADLGLMKALNLRKARDVLAAAEAWRPWRAYAALHLWNGLGAGG